LIRSITSTTWGHEAWPAVKPVLRRALEMRRVRREQSTVIFGEGQRHRDSSFEQGEHQEWALHEEHRHRRQAPLVVDLDEWRESAPVHVGVRVKLIAAKIICR
jgi:hypothetical protein